MMTPKGFRLARFPVYVCQARFKSSRTLGVPPEKAQTLADKLSALSVDDPQSNFQVDIGFALKKNGRREKISDHIKLLKTNKSDGDLERAARDNKIILDLKNVDDDNANSLTPVHVKTAAEHYGIFEHLFGDAYFYPVLPLRILYCEDTVPVYRGNVIKPEEASKTPSVNFKSKPEDLWTLIMTTPDGTTSEVERIHWMLGNIKGNQLSTGEELCHYIQPLPFKGLGYLRYVFILYKQEAPVDYSELGKRLSETRFFSTREFYQRNQEDLTPAGLSFFVSDWDFSVKNYYRTVLEQEPPVFEYDFSPHYYQKQTWFPLREAFNLYLDRYRDQKEIAREYLAKKLKMTDPFKGDLRPKYPYPNAVPFEPNTPLWLKNEMRKERLGRGRSADYK